VQYKGAALKKCHQGLYEGIHLIGCRFVDYRSTTKINLAYPLVTYFRGYTSVLLFGTQHRQALLVALKAQVVRLFVILIGLVTFLLISLDQIYGRYVYAWNRTYTERLAQNTLPRRLCNIEGRLLL